MSDVNKAALQMHFDKGVPLANVEGARTAKRSQVVRDVVGCSVLLAVLAALLALKYWVYFPNGGLL
jgi:hypothetical protein